MWLKYLRLKEKFTINSKLSQDDIKRTLQENIQENAAQSPMGGISDSKYFEGKIDGYSFTIKNPRKSRKGPEAPIIRGEIRGGSVDITMEPDKIMFLFLCFVCIFPILSFLSVLKSFPDFDFYSLFGAFILVTYVTAIFVFFKAAGVRDLVYLSKLLDGKVEEWEQIRAQRGENDKKR